MKNNLIIILIASLALLFSCKKDKALDNPTPKTTYPDFAKLKVGNYWVYELFYVDSLGNGTSENKFDSCFIEKDTVINNLTYFKLSKTCSNIQTPTQFLRDSLHYVVDNSGRILFSSQDFSSVFRTTYSMYTPGDYSDTASKNTFMMAEKDAIVSTPLGSFSTYNYKETITIYPAHVVNSNKRYYNTRYAENIGIVMETIATFMGAPTSIERRLIRYHLN